MNPESPTPYVQQWSFGLQRALPAHLFFQADYVGTKTTHLTALSDFNQPINGALLYPISATSNIATPRATDTTMDWS